MNKHRQTRQPIQLKWWKAYAIHLILAWYHTQTATHKRKQRNKKRNKK